MLHSLAAVPQHGFTRTLPTPPDRAPGASQCTCRIGSRVRPVEKKVDKMVDGTSSSDRPTDPTIPRSSSAQRDAPAMMERQQGTPDGEPIGRAQPTGYDARLSHVCRADARRGSDCRLTLQTRAGSGRPDAAPTRRSTSCASAIAAGASAGRRCTTRCARSRHAARIAGMGYAELAERGITFCLSDMPRLIGLTGAGDRRGANQPRAAGQPGADHAATVPARS